MNRALFVLLMALPVLARPAEGDVQWRSIPYADMHAAFTSANVDGTYIRSRTAFSVRGQGFTLGDLRVEIDGPDGTIVVNIENDGLTDFPLDPALVAADAVVRTNAPRGGLGAAVRFSAEAEPVQRFEYSLYEAMAAEYREAIRAQGLMARMALPRPNGLLLGFDTPDAHARVLLPQPEHLQADAEGNLFIPANRRWRNANPVIELSQQPREIVLAVE